jgi:hypothetical protein
VIRALPALAAGLALAACSSTANPDLYGPPTITPVSGYTETMPGAAELVTGGRWLLMDDVLRECTLYFTQPEQGEIAYEARLGACSHEMIHVAGWRTAGETLDLFNANGEVIGRLTVESAGVLRGKLTVLSGQQVDATLRRL